MAELRSDDTALFVTLQSRVAEYWARVDRVEGATEEPCQSFFSEDAVMVLGALRVEGKPALSEFFDNRERQEIARERTTRHVVNNPRLTVEGPTRATLRAVVVVYAGLGAWPLPAEAPSGIADFTFDCVREADGLWRFSAMTANSVFVGAGAPAFAKKQEQE